MFAKGYWLRSFRLTLGKGWATFSGVARYRVSGCDPLRYTAKPAPRRGDTRRIPALPGMALRPVGCGRGRGMLELKRSFESLAEFDKSRIVHDTGWLSALCLYRPALYRGPTACSPSASSAVPGQVSCTSKGRVSKGWQADFGERLNSGAMHFWWACMDLGHSGLFVSRDFPSAQKKSPAWWRGLEYCGGAF